MASDVSTVLKFVKDECSEFPLVKIKITGDGTCVSHSMHVIVIAFTIIGSKEYFCYSSR